MINTYYLAIWLIFTISIIIFNALTSWYIYIPYNGGITTFILSYYPEFIPPSFVPEEMRH